jgi:hypothetical protein
VNPDEQQEHYDATGEQPNWRSANPLVPSSFRIDAEYNCFTNAENLAQLSRGQLRYTEGKARLVLGADRSWGDHAWTTHTETGEVVDPYFEWRFPGRKIEYRPAP